MQPVLWTERLAGCLSDFELHPDAPAELEHELLDTLWARLQARLADDEFQKAVEKSRKVGLTSTTLSLLTGRTETSESLVEANVRSLERLYEQLGARTGAGLHDKLWRRIRQLDPDVDGKTALLYVIATLADTDTQSTLQAVARERFEEWIGHYQGEIDELSETERQEIDQLLEHAETPTARALALPYTVVSKRDGKSVEWPQHLYQDSNGEYPETLNSWERDVVETELDGVLCWVRNKPRQRWALTVPYETADGHSAPVYPDFLFFRRMPNGVVVDVVDPHGLHLDDAPAKARGLAQYAQRHGHAFNRFQLVIYDKSTGDKRALDLKKVKIRDAVVRVTTNEHLRALFTLTG